MKLSNLDDLRTAEEANYEVSLQRLGDTASLAEDFAEAYGALSRLMRETKDPKHHVYVISILFLAARYQLERAMLDVLRGRLTDGVQATRRAAELAAFAAKIGRHPHLADVWLEASKDDGAYQRYREKFSKDLFPANDELLKRLGSRYDQGSRQFHGSTFSVGGRASVTASAEGVEFEFKTFEIDDDEPAEPASVFLWILDTHFGILAVFVRVLEEQLGAKLTAWEIRKNALDAKFGAHREKWRPIITARSARNKAATEGGDTGTPGAC